MKNIKRPLLVATLGIIIGIIYGLYFKLGIAIFFAILFLISIICMRNKRIFYFIIKKKKAIILVIICALCSNTYVILLNKEYYNFYNKVREDTEIEAIVIGKAKQSEYYNSYNVKAKDKKFIIYVNKNNKQNLEYGMLVKIKGKFIEPEEQRNYKGFNYKQYLKSKKIYGSIICENIEIHAINKTNIIARSSNFVKNKIIDVTTKILPKDTQGLLIGILIGDRTEIEEDITENFRKSSLIHILAISGTHISYIIMGISYILLKSKIPKRISYFIADLVLIFFMFITGFCPSVVRAGLMGILLISSKILYRKPDSLTSISLTLIILLSYNPFAIQDIGLQLSYLGTIGIILLNKPISNLLEKKLPKKIADVLSITISAQIVIIPIIIINFNTISLLFVISNLIAIPLAGIIILYGYFNIFIGMVNINIARIFSVLLNILLKILISIANFVSNISFSNILISTPNLIYIIMYYLIIFINKKYKKFVIVIMLITIILNIVYSMLPHELQIYIIDVGQR